MSLGDGHRARGARPARHPVQDVLRLPRHLRRTAQHQRLPGLPRASRARCRCRTARRCGSACAAALALGCTVHPPASSRARTISIPTCPRDTRSPSSTVRSRPAGGSRSSRRSAARCRSGITRLHLEEDAGQVAARPLSRADRGGPQPGRRAAGRDRERARPALAGRGAGVPHRAQADPGLRRRERLHDGEGEPPGGRQHLGAARRARASSAPRPR